MIDNRLVNTFLDESVHAEKSPLLEGSVQGAKAALVAAPLGAVYGLLRNKKPALYGALTGAAAGTAFGLVAAAAQKYENMKREAELKYHMQNVIERNPEILASTAPQFAQGFQNVYHPH